MDPAHKKYLILYALIVIPLAASFLFIRRGSPRPSRLHLKSDQSPSGGKEQEALRREASGAHGSGVRPATALNVFFMWNGHSWDAYEVLGIPAGSSRESAIAAFEKATAGGSADSMLFFKAALEAIVESASTRS